MVLTEKNEDNGSEQSRKRLESNEFSRRRLQRCIPESLWRNVGSSYDDDLGHHNALGVCCWNSYLARMEILRSKIKMRLQKLAIIASSLGLAVATIPLALSMLPSELHLVYIGFKIYMFGIVPAVFLYLIETEKKKKTKHRGKN